LIFDLELKNPSSIALRDSSGHELSYGHLIKVINENKSLLIKRSLVIVLADNTTSVVSFLLACFENKWVPLLLNKSLDKKLLENYIDIYKPNAIFYNEEIAPSSYDIKERLTWDNHKIDILSYASTLLFEELSLLLPTSGSTGSPKLVRHSYENILFSANNVSKLFNLNSSDFGLAVLPIYYTMGLSVVTSHLQAGASIFLSNVSLTEKSFWDILKFERITTFTGVPYTFEVLFKLRFEKVVNPSLRIISQGGGKLPEPIWDKLQEYCNDHKIEFIPTYGQTEGTARLSYLDSEYVKDKKGSIGKAIPGGQFEIWDDNGNILINTVTEGELIYKGLNVTLGYADTISDLEKGDERHGILPTGDIVKRDQDGYYFIIGRKKRFVKIYGLRISLDEVEQLVINKFNIDCFVTGSDNTISVYVTVTEMEKEIKNWLSATLNLFHQAIEILFVEEIPRSASGKVVLKSLIDNNS
jgi:acyl-coenzyme A synthetase/AMP-(fatty) acid ligase